MKEEVYDAQHASSVDFMSTFLARYSPPAQSVAHFNSVPWLARYLNDPVYEPIPTFSRHLKTTGEDYFFSRTINTLETIPHMISLQLKHLETPDPESPALAIEGDKKLEKEVGQHRVKTVVPEKPDALILITLGNPGIDGHPATLHGGMICAILDETMGLMVMLHEENIHARDKRDGRASSTRQNIYTANLNVSYRAPVPTPGHVIVRTWLVKRQGRKWFSKGQIVDESGKVLAEADGLWVAVKGNL